MKSLYTAFGGTYREVGDYMLPNVKCPNSVNTGIWGQHRERYLRTERKVVYFNLLTTGKLKDHLEEVDRSAREIFERLVLQMEVAEGLTEKMKADAPLEWIRRMNNICNCAHEIVYKELICV